MHPFGHMYERITDEIVPEIPLEEDSWELNNERVPASNRFTHYVDLFYTGFSFIIYPIAVLVNPQLGENIGTAARAMANFGLHELRLVEPRDGRHRALAAERFLDQELRVPARRDLR